MKSLTPASRDLTLGNSPFFTHGVESGSGNPFAIVFFRAKESEQGFTSHKVLCRPLDSLGSSLPEGMDPNGFRTMVRNVVFSIPNPRRQMTAEDLCGPSEVDDFVLSLAVDVANAMVRERY